LGYNIKMPFEHCEHVYRNMKQNPCPKCKGETHEINWEEQHELHREWITSGKAVSQGWWSI
jgi:hypothetical protein